AHVYHNVVIGMLPEKGLNNGQPGLWALLFDRLDLAPGKRVLHLGCGTGYYSAILAEIVGPSGRVTAVDCEEGLVARAVDGLRSWPQASAVAADGATFVPEATDIIVASAGATHPLPQWLDALPPGGQLLLPLTGERGWGQTLLIARRPDGESSCPPGGRASSHCGRGCVAPALATMMSVASGTNVAPSAATAEACGQERSPSTALATRPSSQSTAVTRPEGPTISARMAL